MQVNVSLVVIRVLVTAQVTSLHLQLLGTHHGRTDGSVSRPMELTQVNLYINGSQKQTVTVFLQYFFKITPVSNLTFCVKMEEVKTVANLTH